MTMKRVVNAVKENALGALALASAYLALPATLILTGCFDVNGVKQAIDEKKSAELKVPTFKLTIFHAGTNGVTVIRGITYWTWGGEGRAVMFIQGKQYEAATGDCLIEVEQ